MSIERLRALEKAVELVAKATRGPWAFMNEKYDDCLLAFGTDTLDHDAPPPWYSCWTSINPDDGRALIAAVNFIREHGSALIAELGQEVGAVEPVSFAVELADGTLGALGWIDYAKFEQVKYMGTLAKGARYVFAYRTSPAHTSEARDAVLKGVRELAIKAAAHWDADEDMKVGKILMALAGQLPKYDKRADAFDAAMRQEGGSDA